MTAADTSGCATEREGTEARLGGLTAGGAATPAGFLTARARPEEMPSWWHDPALADRPLPRLVHPAPITDPALRGPR